MTWQSLLRKLYPEPAWLVIEEVRNGTGYARRQTRTADALVIGTWPSRGLEVIGIEVKQSRSDWLRELKDPAKAEEIYSYCDRWALLATDEAIAKIEEIPKPWGYLCATEKKDRLKVVKAPPELTPKAIDRLFLAAIVRAARTGTVPQSELAALLATERTRITNDAERHRKHLEHEVQRLQLIINNFEREARMSLTHRWSSEDEAIRVGKAVRFVLDGGVEKFVTQAERLGHDLGRIAHRLQEVVEVHRGSHGPTALGADTDAARGAGRSVGAEHQGTSSSGDVPGDERDGNP